MSRFKARVTAGERLHPGQRLWFVEIWDTSLHRCVVTDHTGSWEVMQNYAVQGVRALESASIWGLYRKPRDRWWARSSLRCPCWHCTRARQGAAA